jgi:hypothetical protein
LQVLPPIVTAIVLDRTRKGTNSALCATR